MVPSRLSAQIPKDSLIFYRIGFGLLMVAAALRQLYYGWVDQFYVEPRFLFGFEGFTWLKPLGSFGMTTVFVGMALCALGLAIGWRTRFWALGFFLLFTYVELLDKTTYLNHYYLVSILALLMVLIPGKNEQTIAAGWLYLMRVQVGLVYFFAGVAKLESDWLLRAQPLKTWLAAHQDFILLGRFLGLDGVAYLASWSGAAFDLMVPFLLCVRRTRMPAFIILVIFHIFTGMLFNLGIFPWVMVINASLFFAPDWPKALTGVFTKAAPPIPFPPRLAWLLAGHLILQGLLPLRHFLYQGDVLWDEQGFRFSWRVMLIEKSGLVRFTVRDVEGRESIVYPFEYLTLRQAKMMSTQPDMIVQFAHYVATQRPGVAAIFADSYVALNGRRSQVYLDPQVNLLEVSSLQAGRLVLPRIVKDVP